MRKFTRLPAPSILTENHPNEHKPRWQVYGERYKTNRTQNPSHEFQWPTIVGSKLNHLLLPDLQAQTQAHCSYCDIYPLMKGDDTIDHFCPKSSPDHYDKVCQWENLYIACKSCQDSKLAHYSELILRPDEINYQFNNYFSYDYINHKIEIRNDIDEISKAKAAETIRIFDLNHTSHSKARSHAYERFVLAANPELEDYNYRFMFD